MKKSIIFALLLLFVLASNSFAGNRPYKDAYGHSYSSQENLYKDSDGDGVSNYYDIDDRNPRRTTY